MSVIPLLVNGLSPAFVDKKTASEYLGSPKLVERMLWSTRHTDDKWIKIAMNAEGDPKQKTLIDTRSLEQAAERILRGERPPKIGKLSFFMGHSFVEDIVTGKVSRAFPDSFDPDAEEERMEGDRAVARKNAEAQERRDAEELEAEKEKLHRKVPEEETERNVQIEIDL